MSNPRYQPISIEGGINSSSSLGGRRQDSAFIDEPDDGDIDDLHNNVTKSNDWKIIGGFWILGLLNNSSYVIMLASAKSISEGGTGLVFLTTVTPSLLIKLTAPYWFDRVDYAVRLGTASLCMVIAFALVGSCKTLLWRLLGVAFISVAEGLGEPCLLALAGRFDGAAVAPRPRHRPATSSLLQSSGDDELPPTTSAPQQKETGRCLTAFASGTGFAGVFGFFWKWFWNDWLGFAMSTTLWLAMCIPFGYWNTFRYVMTHDQKHNVRRREALVLRTEQHSHPTSIPTVDQRDIPHDGTISLLEVASLTLDTDEANSDYLRNRRDGKATPSDDGMAKSRAEPTAIDGNGDPSDSYNGNEDLGSGGEVSEISQLSSKQRFHLVLSLWPYTVPLFVVYAAEYTLQSGTWTAIGFPVDDVESRKSFYQYSNWLYQAGVFVSRSSGTLFTVPMAVLWLMPTLQTLNVVIYWSIAANQQDSSIVGSFWHSPTFLYTTAFYTGLLGGAVYIHGYKRICKDITLAHREFALSATSVAESFGILMADLSGLVIQACLYRINKLDGAVLTCPF
jgi:battenin